PAPPHCPANLHQKQTFINDRYGLITALPHLQLSAKSRRSVYLQFLLLEVGFLGAINMGAFPKAATVFSQLMSI
ncbi:hypothetical protein, partial [Pseudomonas izuensis]|uniref:hypothetical protein n=1 Tax=Pseudomonas izuensis TaxID=2684212 RepID=UPI001C49B5AC